MIKWHVGKTIYVLGMVLAVNSANELALPWSWRSASIAVLLGLVGGGFMQLVRADRGTLDWPQALGEWGLCAVGAFLAFAAAVHMESSVPKVWGSSVIGGCAGSEFVVRVIRTRKNGNR